MSRVLPRLPAGQTQQTGRPLKVWGCSGAERRGRVGWRGDGRSVASVTTAELGLITTAGLASESCQFAVSLAKGPSAAGLCPLARGFAPTSIPPNRAVPVRLREGAF